MYYSPQMLLHHRHLDFNKHCKHAFGAYVQAHDELAPSNTLQASNLDCIYLHPTTSWQGEHQLLHLPTHCFNMRRNITELPITKNVLIHIEQQAPKEKMPQGFKTNF